MRQNGLKPFLSTADATYISECDEYSTSRCVYLICIRPLVLRESRDRLLGVPSFGATSAVFCGMQVRHWHLPNALRTICQGRHTLVCNSSVFAPPDTGLAVTVFFHCGICFSTKTQHGIYISTETYDCYDQRRVLVHYRSALLPHERIRMPWNTHAALKAFFSDMFTYYLFLHETNETIDSISISISPDLYIHQYSGLYFSNSPLHSEPFALVIDVDTNGSPQLRVRSRCRATFDI